MKTKIMESIKISTLEEEYWSKIEHTCIRHSDTSKEFAYWTNKKYHITRKMWAKTLMLKMHYVDATSGAADGTAVTWNEEGRKNKNGRRRRSKRRNWQWGKIK